MILTVTFLFSKCERKKVILSYTFQIFSLNVVKPSKIHCVFDFMHFNAKVKFAPIIVAKSGNYTFLARILCAILVNNDILMVFVGKIEMAH